MLLLGYDIGSSSIKASVIDAQSGETLGTAQYPEVEMDMIAHQHGWAEQDPEMWWDYVKKATQKLFASTGQNPANVKSIGIAYQMHGLVLVDEHQNSLRPSIIWCDSRAVQIGEKAFQEIGESTCLRSLLNSPGNFTASKLAWVKENEPEIFAKIDKIMLPGDFIAMKLTGEIMTTPSGLSEGIFWDFQTNDLSQPLLDYYGFDRSVFPKVVPTFSDQGELKDDVCVELRFSKGTKVGYRAGDQPNNAFALNALNPGEVAATGGTSGVVYGVIDKLQFDPQNRVNSFAHVNHTDLDTRIGVLLCINGTGCQYSWVKNQLAQQGLSYFDLEKQASKVSIGSDGLTVLPFGNGAERMLGNKVIGSHMNNLDFNRHSFAHLTRATLEGIAFSFIYGMKVMKEMGLELEVIRAGNDNLFQSAIFGQTIAELSGAKIELIETTGAVAAARGAGVGTGIYASMTDAFSELKVTKIYEPNQGSNQEFAGAFDRWSHQLNLLNA